MACFAWQQWPTLHLHQPKKCINTTQKQIIFWQICIQCTQHVLVNFTLFRQYRRHSVKTDVPQTIFSPV